MTGGKNDFNGDWRNDLIARETATGDLWRYHGDGAGALNTRTRVGIGWNGMTAIRSVGDLNGDDHKDLLARDGSGTLWLYRGSSSGGWQPRIRIGTGWNAINGLAGVGDLSGDGRADIVAREARTGYLHLYRSTGAGGFSARVRLGTSSGWNVMTALVGPGDFNGDRRADLLAVDGRTGYLWLYPGTGAGGLAARVRVGTSSGWGAMSALVGVGDFDGDRRADMLTRERSTGYLWLYPGDGTGGFATRMRVGAATWNGMNSLA